MEPRQPLPPFTEATARQKIQMAEDAWNSKDPERVAIIAFLERKWARELDYTLKKDYWAHGGNRIAVRSEYEWHDDDGNWFRSYGNENWEFDELGYMRKRYASINDVAITASERHL